MAKRSGKSFEAQIAELQQSERRLHARGEEVLRRTEKWLWARGRGDEVGAAAIERADPALARRLRAFEKDMAPPSDPDERAQTFRRLREALLVMRMQDALREAVEETCPLCAELGIAH